MVPVTAAPAATAPVEVGPTWPVATDASSLVFQQILAQQQRVLAVHQAHLARQQQLHQAFSHARSASLQVLAGLQAPASAVADFGAAAQPALSAFAEQAPGAATQAPAQAPPAQVAAQPAPSSAPAIASAPALPSAPAARPAPVTARPALRPSAAPAVQPTPAARPTPARTPVAPAVTPEVLPGPKFSREDLEVMASGLISSRFGPLFERQDGYARQVRMPEPPLLLADRVTGIDAEPGALALKGPFQAKGTIWTETDVTWDSWYLHQGVMPPGIMIESGQADLLLISWLGVDFLNQSERVYRLLGCELTYSGGQPRPGDTLCYDIHVDGHANQGDIRLFFFHYDCKVDGQPRLSVRGGQAGFFTDEELANSAGVLWTPEEGEHTPDSEARVDPPRIAPTKASYSREELETFADGRAAEVFGPGFELLSTHVRSPRIPKGRMLLFDEVTHLDPQGGPWKRGYLRAVAHIRPDLWYFDGHFKGDPCMPGTLMFDGCLQAMTFYLCALGFSVDKDGWRAEPVPDVPYPLICRGQVLPSSHTLVYEIFVDEVVDGEDGPTLWADLLCTVIGPKEDGNAGQPGGLKAFHAQRMGMRLVPDWPMNERPDLLAHDESDPRPVAVVPGEAPAQALGLPAAAHPEFRFDYRSLMACAWGRPSEAFGQLYQRFDSPMRVARLPGPPYHFMTRVTQLDHPIGLCKPGGSLELAYDIPEDAWYFRENGNATMPFAVLLEAALQPCGWLASYVGSATTVEEELSFRNLDGSGTLHEELGPISGTLRTRVTMTKLSRTAGMIIQGFKVECYLGEGEDERLVYDLNTVFGFFPLVALQNQKGLPTTEEGRAWLARPCDYQVDLTSHPAPWFGEDRAQLAMVKPPRHLQPAGMEGMSDPNSLFGLLMIDRVTGWWPEAGEAGLGRMRAEKTVDPGEWFFKAHFFQDPVQPGSLGIEALLQLLQFFMLEQKMDADMSRPRFEPLMLGAAMTWKYRGQVIPTNKLIQTEIEITETGRDDRGTFAIAKGSLWVDGRRIYETSNMGMRIVDTNPPAPRPEGDEDDSEGEPSGPWRLDARTDSWLSDHCPTWTVPALPLASALDRVARAARQAHPGLQLVGVDTLAIGRWLHLAEGPLVLETELGDARVIDGDTLQPVTLSVGDSPAVRAVVRLGRAGPVPRRCAEPLLDAQPVADPYGQGLLFHGPQFQVLTDWQLGSNGARAVLNTDIGSSVPGGPLDALLLDGATHAIPHDRLSRWNPALDDSQVAYPLQITDLRVAGPAPARGEAVVEVRWVGQPNPRQVRFAVEIHTGNSVWCSYTLTEVLVPKGPIGAAAPDARRSFLRDRVFVDGVALSRVVAGGPGAHAVSELRPADVEASAWLPGTVEAVYDLSLTEARERDVAIAIKEHIARADRVHPSQVSLEEGEAGLGGERFARSAKYPLQRRSVLLSRHEGAIRVADGGAPRTELTPLQDWWRERLQTGHWIVEDIYYGLVQRFLRRLVVTDPAALAAMNGPALYLGNHQTGVESLLFSIVVGGLTRTPTLTLAKIEHKTTWLGRLIAHSFSYPGIDDPGVITFFDRSDRGSLPRVIGELGEALADGRSVMVHVEGTRARHAHHQVQLMSSAFIELAIRTGVPIVPIRFSGGLPEEELETRLEFPVGMGQQDYLLGSPIDPATLAALPLKERKQLVIDAINALDDGDMPLPGDAGFARRVEAWAETTGASPEHAVLARILAETEVPCEDSRIVVGDSDPASLPDDARGRWLRELISRLR